MNSSFGFNVKLSFGVYVNSLFGFNVKLSFGVYVNSLFGVYVISLYGVYEWGGVFSACSSFLTSLVG